MKFEILNKGNFEVLNVVLDNNETFRLESGSMMSMSEGITLEGKSNGGFIKALTKSTLGGENFFMTTATSHKDNSEIMISPKGFGTITHIKLDGSTNWYLEDGTFLACNSSVDFDVRRQKGVATSLFAGTGGFFILKTSGVGDLFVESFGSVIEKELDGNEPFIVDNNHLIGWEDTLHHEIVVASGTFGFKTGEGFAIKLTGRGKILMQSRQPEAFSQTIIPFIPTQR